MESGEETTNWHIRKEISVGHLGTTLMVVIAMVAGWYQMQNRLIRLEEHLTSPAHAGAQQRLGQLEEKMARTEAIDAAMAARLESLHAEILRRMDHTDVTLGRIEDRLNSHDKRNVP